MRTFFKKLLAFKQPRAGGRVRRALNKMSIARTKSDSTVNERAASSSPRSHRNGVAPCANACEHSTLSMSKTSTGITKSLPLSAFSPSTMLSSRAAFVDSKDLTESTIGVRLDEEKMNQRICDILTSCRCMSQQRGLAYQRNQDSGTLFYAIVMYEEDLRKYREYHQAISTYVASTYGDHIVVRYFCQEVEEDDSD